MEIIVTEPVFPGTTSDFYGFVCHNFDVDGREARVVEPVTPLPNRPWIWRTMYWDAFPGVERALLDRGYYVAHIEIGKTYASPESLAPFDTFYRLLTTDFSFSPRPVLEGLSLGGLYNYRWAQANPEKVGVLYGDAPLCSLKIYPGPRGSRPGNEEDFQRFMDEYHLTNDEDYLTLKGSPIDTLAPLAAENVPIIHVIGDLDEACVPSENSDIVHERYTKLGGNIVVIVKHGCAHHPHGLADPTPVVDYIMAYTAGEPASIQAAVAAPKPGAVIHLAPGEW